MDAKVEIFLITRIMMCDAQIRALSDLVISELSNNDIVKQEQLKDIIKKRNLENEIAFLKDYLKIIDKSPEWEVALKTLTDKYTSDYL